jgi:hypothetical protein
MATHGIIVSLILSNIYQVVKICLKTIHYPVALDSSAIYPTKNYKLKMNRIRKRENQLRITQ